MRREQQRGEVAVVDKTDGTVVETPSFLVCSHTTKTAEALTGILKSGGRPLVPNRRDEERLIANGVVAGANAFIGDESRCYVRASMLLTDLADHWPPRDVLMSPPPVRMPIRFFTIGPLIWTFANGCMPFGVRSVEANLSCLRVPQLTSSR